MYKHDYSICVLDFVINDVIIVHVRDDECESIDMNNYFFNMISKYLTLIPGNDHNESHQGPFLDLDDVSTMLDVVPLVSLHTFPNDIDWDKGEHNMLEVEFSTL